MFAEQVGKDLGLSGEARPLIAAALREQLLLHKRSVLDLELLGSGATYERALRDIEQAYADELEEQQRKAAGLPPAAAVQNLPPLSAIPPHMRQSMTSGTATGTQTPTDDARSETGEDGGGGGDGDETAAVREESLAAEPGRRSSRRFQSPPPPAEIVSTPAGRRRQAEAILADLLGKGPKPLQGVWRDWMESREFGPLLEPLSDDALQKIEQESLRRARCVSFEAEFRRLHVCSLLTWVSLETHAELAGEKQTASPAPAPAVVAGSRPHSYTEHRVVRVSTTKACMQSRFDIRASGFRACPSLLLRLGRYKQNGWGERLALVRS